MKVHSRFLTFLLLLCASLSATAQSTLTLEDIQRGVYGAQRPRVMRPYYKGAQYTQLNTGRTTVELRNYSDGALAQTLVDITTLGQPSLKSLDNYEFSPDGQWLLLQTDTRSIYRRSFTARFFLYNLATQQVAAVAEGKPIQCPIFSKDGSRMAYVSSNNIYTFATAAPQQVKQVTTDGQQNKVINGIPDWVYEEEFGFNCGMTFTSDAQHLCWIRWDESQVEQYTLQLFQGEKPALTDNADYPGEYTYKYPKAGHDNAKVSAWAYNIATAQTQQLNVPMDADGYIPRIVTGSKAANVYYYTMNRHQDNLHIYDVDAKSGSVKEMMHEQIDKYITEDAMSGISFTDRHILVPSDRSGYMQLYLYDHNGKLLRQVTRQPLIVTEVYGYDEATGDTYYQATNGNATERAVYVTHKNGKTDCLTPKKGWNTAAFSADYRYFIHSWSDADTPWQYAVADRKGNTVKVLEDNHALQQKLQPLQLSKKRFFTFTTSEGVELNGVMILPRQMDESKKHPVVMYQYSGPGSQQAVNSWSLGSTGGNALFDHYLTEKGFIVVIVDGRGTGARGADFEKCTYLELGDKEAKDQVETALYLGTLPYVDKDNIGIWGWSYGGFCTLMSMSEGRPVFKAGVAVAAPTNWKYYDSVYTERFMRTPKENANGYAINPITRATQLHGELLLCHGLADDNVHPQNLFEYSERLVQAGKDFRELVYTNRNHSIYGGNTRRHLFKQIVDFFVENLQGK